MIRPFVIFFFSVFFSTALWAQSYLEEVANLERIYESRARVALNTIMRPEDYSIIVSAEINRDLEKIEKYREERDASLLPGMPSAELGEFLGLGTNELDDLKSNLTVHLVLNKTVEDKQEDMITQILRSKLHLDTDLGDKIVIQRSQINLDKPRLPASAPPLPEPNNRLSLMIIAILLGLLAAAYIFSRRKKDDEKIQRVEAAFDPPPFKDEPAADPAPLFSGEGEESSGLGDQVYLDRIEMSKAELLGLVEEFPFLVVNAASDFFKQGHEKELMILFQTLGWDVARREFKALPEKIWAQLGHLVQTDSGDEKIQKISEVVAMSTRFILSKVLSLGKYGDGDSPFSFLFDLRSSERKRLLSTESADRLAIIGFCSSDEEFAEILQDLPPDRQKELISKVTKVDSLPEVTVRQTSNYLREKIESSKGKMDIEANGPAKAAKILRMLPAEDEEAMFLSIARDRPEQAEKIRRSLIRFQDLPILPRDIIEPALGAMEIDDIVPALSGQNGELVNYVVGFLPPKKAKVVRGDLQFKGHEISPRDRARAHRKICLRFESLLKAKGLTVEQVWKTHQQQTAL